MDKPGHSLVDYIGQKSRILVMCHNNPDPDSIASAAALKSIFHQKLRRKVVIGYGGTIGRAENRALIRRLKIDMIHVKDIDFKHFSVICLVDSQPRTGNNSVPFAIIPDIVVDHHPLRSITRKVPFHDVRPDYGSTSTIMTEYLRELDLQVDKILATALFYGLKTDTNGLLRSSVKADLDAFNFLFPKIVPKTLASIENPEIPRSYYLKFADAIGKSIQYKDVIISNMGKLNNPDIPAEMADFLLRMENIRWTLCMGEFKDQLIMSVRTSRRGEWAGKVAIKILRGLGTGGGHEQAAGGRVFFAGLSNEDRNQKIVKITNRFLKALGVDNEKPKPLVVLPA
ncbi:MAG: bifunctional oligoribonuclease/PAP phosphatase NrnA [Deltaproteobacteria bacterium]|nr:bifunctional oligoribonuclease/PAP phosphatase NrnA [Deltaproteobacteria bacterium]